MSVGSMDEMPMVQHPAWRPAAAAIGRGALIGAAAALTQLALILGLLYATGLVAA